MLAEFTSWLVGLIRDAFTALFELVTDVFVGIVELICNALVTILGLIPVPPFLADGLQGMFSGLAGGILWVVTAAGLPQALAIIGAGYAFRLARKFFTLFQW